MLSGSCLRYWMTGSQRLGSRKFPLRADLADPGSISTRGMACPTQIGLCRPTMLSVAVIQFTTNSTVMSKAFYLMSEGGVFNGYTVQQPRT